VKNVVSRLLTAGAGWVVPAVAAVVAAMAVVADAAAAVADAVVVVVALADRPVAALAARRPPQVREVRLRVLHPAREQLARRTQARRQPHRLPPRTQISIQ
jgi:hypothetical protein